MESIQLLRQLGDLDRVRRAREEMSRVFPLSEGECDIVFVVVVHTRGPSLAGIALITEYEIHQRNFLHI